MNGFVCPAPLAARDTVLLGHGSGGKLSAELLHDIFLPAFRESRPRPPGRSGRRWSIGGARLAFTTDSFVVKPLFFRGGDIGSLAVHGTVNDLAMGGARPLYLSAAFILEEGFPHRRPAPRSSASMAGGGRSAGVTIVTGDTKVVERGSGDGVYINTTGHRPGARWRAPLRGSGAAGRRSHPERRDRRPRHRRSWPNAKGWNSTASRRKRFGARSIRWWTPCSPASRAASADARSRPAAAWRAR